MGFGDFDQLGELVPGAAHLAELFFFSNYVRRPSAADEFLASLCPTVQPQMAMHRTNASD
jgi:hypothetical protein